MTTTSNQFSRQNTDLNFGRVRKYERFDPSASHHKELSPDFEDLPRLEYDLMSDLEEVLSRGKAEVGLPHRNGGGHQSAPAVSTNVAGSMATPPLPGRPPQPAASDSVRKASVGDLINLEAEEDTELEVVFDPLASESASGGVPSHRKLSRTGGSNPFGIATANSSATTLSSQPGRSSVNSYGKYENYTPPAGTSQAHFKQFLSSMTVDPSTSSSTAAPVRSSDDLLSEYGLHFGGLSLQAGNSTSLMSETKSSVVGPAAMYANGSVVGGTVLPPPLYSRPNFPAAAPPPPPRSGPLPPAAAPGRPSNSSFLFSSSQAFAAPSDIFALSDATGAMPVNQRIRSAPLDKNQVGDLLADLDPLRPSAAASVSHQSGEVELAGGIRPPAVPPRVRKSQWTTFE
jgi:hypothetical protein